MTAYCSTVDRYMNRPHLLYPLIYQCTRWYFHVFGIVHNASVNMGVYISFRISVLFSSDIYSEMELLGYIFLLLFFSVISILLFIVAAPVYIPTNSQQAFPLFLILLNSYLFDSSHSDRCEVILWFSFAFLWWWVMFSIFSFTVGYLYVFFEKMSIQMLRPFLKADHSGVFCYWVLWMLYALILTTYQIHALQMFSLIH